jgi:outer membrane immunogenic protein
MKKLLMIGVAVGVMSVSSTAAMSADVSAPVAFDWTGLYFGGYVGYTNFDTEILGADNSFDGITGGGIIGANYQIDQIVMGLEGDIGFTGANGNFVAPIAHSQDVDMTYAVRARLGYAADNTLFFLQGGVAFAEFGADAGGVSILDDTLTGWQIGAGVEHAFTENITVRLDGLYTDYGNTDDITVAPAGFDVINFTVRLGVNFLF